MTQYSPTPGLHRSNFCSGNNDGSGHERFTAKYHVSGIPESTACVVGSTGIAALTLEMGMKLGVRTRVQALLLMATQMALTSAAGTKKYGDPCSSSLECSSSAPFCQIYLVDSSMEHAQRKMEKKKSFASVAGFLDIMPATHGFCTECETDCNCDVGEFCAVSAPSTHQAGLRSASTRSSRPKATRLRK